MLLSRSFSLVVLALLLSGLPACSKNKPKEAPGYAIEDLWIETERLTFKDNQRWGDGAVEVKDSSESKIPLDSALAERCQGQAMARENIEDPQGFARVAIRDKRLRKAIERHEAWISVDLMEESTDRDRIREWLLQRSSEPTPGDAK